MANLLTATLDDVARKRGDLYPITATLRANGAVANLTGATITITMVDNLTRALVVLGGACTITDAVNGKVSYQPVLADMDREGVLDVEFKEVLAGVTSHFPCADYSSLRLWPTLDLPPFIPQAAGINDHSVTLLNMAQQTPGAVLIYDASGNAAVLADVAANNVLLSGGVGLPPSYGRVPYAAIQNVSATNVLLGRKSAGAGAMEELLNSGTAAGRVYLPVLIQEQAVSASAGYTSPTWAAGAYREIIVRFRGTYSAFAFTGFRVNGDTGNNYTDLGFNNNSAVGSDSSVTPALGYARVGVTVTGAIKYFCEIHFDPRTDGNERTGWAISGTSSTGNISAQEQRGTSFGWVNKASDVVNVSLMLSTAAAMTGVVEIWGVPA